MIGSPEFSDSQAPHLFCNYHAEDTGPGQQVAYQGSQLQRSQAKTVAPVLRPQALHPTSLLPNQGWYSCSSPAKVGLPTDDREQSLTRDLGVLFWKMEGVGRLLSKPRKPTCDHLPPDSPLPHLELRLKKPPFHKLTTDCSCSGNRAKDTGARKMDPRGNGTENCCKSGQGWERVHKYCKPKAGAKAT